MAKFYNVNEKVESRNGARYAILQTEPLEETELHKGQQVWTTRQRISTFLRGSLKTTVTTTTSTIHLGLMFVLFY